ncbi:MAG: alanine racemase [Parcubacteria bacterium C7867-008]|nr:MAG: alanine racemase [Parcubacteria bacterium C7867-008]
MTLSRIIARIERFFNPTHPLIEVSISRENLLHNLHTYQQMYPHLTFAPVLKSNAYGHGLCLIARLLDKEKIAFFMVDSLYEAHTLRRGGVHSRILVLGYVRPEDIARNHLRNVDFAVVDIEQLRALTKVVHHTIRIHLKLDTGMHRQGIMQKDIPEAISLIQSNKHLNIVAAGSHFADADGPNPGNTEKQVAVWKEGVAQLTTAFPSIEHKHISATKGVRWAEEAGTNVGRLGIGLYGFDTSHDEHAALKPVMELRTMITSIRDIPVGDFVGYNATYTATKPVRIATVPVGYFEGIDRALSNNGSMLVCGKRALIAGRVSMNMSSIEITDIPEAKQGEEVIAISRNPEDDCSVEHMAMLAGTTPYVLLTHIPQHLRYTPD